MRELFPLLMRHLELAEVIKSHSEQMLNLAIGGDSQNVDHISENRQRVVNLLSSIQSQIEVKLPTIQDREVIEVVKTWHQDFTQLLRETDELDQKTLAFLEEDKVKTKREIGVVFTNQQKISAYNHSESKT